MTLEYSHAQRPELLKNAARLLAQRADIYVSLADNTGILNTLEVFEAFVENAPPEARALAAAAIDDSLTQQFLKAKARHASYPHEGLKLLEAEVVVEKAGELLSNLSPYNPHTPMFKKRVGSP